MTVTLPSTAAEPGTSPARRRVAVPHPLLRFVVWRLVLIVPMVLILVSVVFFLLRATGDPITASLGGQLPPAELAKRLHEAGYDRPLLAQYGDFLRGIVTLDFGTTLTDHQPVTHILTTYGTATLELVVNALLVALVLGVPLGALAAHRRDTGTDAALRVGAILFYATPLFFLGLLLKLVFSLWLGWFPVAGRMSLDSQEKLDTLVSQTGIGWLDALRLGDGHVLLDVLHHSVLPSVALGVVTAGIFLRLVRANMIGTLGTDYVVAARSRGIGERAIVTQHAFKPAAVPIITVMGLQVAALLGGAVLTETTFEWKGLGFELTQYIAARDFVAVQGIVVLLAVIVAVVSFLVDIAALLLDPRVRY